MSGVEIFECDQNTPEWKAARSGLATASEFHSILAQGEGKTRRSYMLRLASERITGAPTETYENADMVRGRVMEPEARDFYSFTTNSELRRVGFIKNGNAGCSPDSLIGDDGMLEIKTQRADLLIETLLEDKFPTKHKAQCQGALWIAEREWIDLVIYWPKMPTFIKRVGRDANYIANLARQVEDFNLELAHIVNRIRKIGTAS